MNVERAAAACIFPGFRGLTAPDWVLRWVERGLGGVVLFSRNVSDPEQLAALTASLRAESPELVVAVDEEGGDVTRLETTAGSSFPGNLALGAVDDPALTRRVAAAIGGELAAGGVNLDLAPVADVLVDPASAIVGVRSFGSDPQLVARHVAAFVEGVQSVGVAACAKHFPGHGETVADSHLELPVADTDRETLRARALSPFAAAVDAGVRAVMTAHVRFAAFGDEPATHNAALLGLLRSELGFSGVVMTDALEMQGAGGPAGVEDSAITALAAGADALCLGADLTPAQVEGVHLAIGSAVREGLLAEQRVHEAAARVAELWPEPTIAAGAARHGLGEILGAESLRLTEGDALPPLDAARPLVLVLRDAHRHPWQRALVSRHAVVVETGVPEWRPEGARAYIASYGAGRANLEAVAGVLRGG